MANKKRQNQTITSTQSASDTDLLTMLDEAGKRLKIDELDFLDPILLDRFSFKSAKPKKWPAWTDLSTDSSKPSNPDNRNGVIKALHDLCSKAELVLNPSENSNELGQQDGEAYRARLHSVRKKLVLLEDSLSPANPLPLLSVLKEADKKLELLDPNRPDISVLERFSFQPGKPGLFTTWSDLDMSASESGIPSNRSAVITALRDLISKSSLMLDRPACQRTLGTPATEKWRAMIASINEKLSVLGDALSPPNFQPLLLLLEEVSRRFQNVTAEAIDLTILDSFAFRPGKPGLFTAWSDLDITDGRTGSSNNRGAVIMALGDLIAKFDQMLDRPACQKALGEAAIQTYSSMRIAVEEKLRLINEAIMPKETYVKQAPTESSPSEFPIIASSPDLPPLREFISQEQKLIERVKKQFGDTPPIIRPVLFTQTTWIHAGAVAGSSMAITMLASIIFHALARAVPIIGLAALAGSLALRHRLVASVTKQCAAAKELYNHASTNNDIENIFPFLTQDAQACFLVGLDADFRANISKRFGCLKDICLHIDSYLSSTPESAERTYALANFPKEGLGKASLKALVEKGSGI
jgi:hypothetical protein